MRAGQTQLHGTAVQVGARAVLILGASGQGKSALALQLMAYGGQLIADDRVDLTRRGAQIWAAAPPALPALIEARGVGLLRADLAPPAPVALVVNLDHQSLERLPPWHEITLLGVEIALVYGPMTGHLAAAIWQYLKAGRGE